MKHCFTAPTLFVIPQAVKFPDYSQLTEVDKVRLIIDYVHAKTGYSYGDMQMKLRKRNLVLARQVVCYLAWCWKIGTYKMLGEQLGGRDHTTAIHGRETMQNLIFADQVPEHLLWIHDARDKGFEIVLPFCKHKPNHNEKVTDTIGA